MFGLPGRTLFRKFNHDKESYLARGGETPETARESRRRGLVDHIWLLEPRRGPFYTFGVDLPNVEIYRRAVRVSPLNPESIPCCDTARAYIHSSACIERAKLLYFTL